MRAKEQIPERKRRSREEIERLVEFCRHHGLALSILQRHLKRRYSENAQVKQRLVANTA
jgi:hypothetical protein